MLSYLHYLFIDTEKPLSKQSYAAALGMLWFFNMVITLAPLPSTLYTMMIGNVFGSSELAIHSTSTIITAFSFPFSIPWFFFLLVGNILLMRRIYQKLVSSWGLSIGAGIIGYLTFRAIIVLPFFLTGMLAEIYIGVDEIQFIINSTFRIWGYILLPISALGLYLIFQPFSFLESSSMPSREGRNRESFGKWYGKISVLWSLLSTAFVIIIYTYSDNLYDDTSLGALSLMNFVFLIFYIEALVSRLRNAGKSFLHLLWLLSPLVGIFLIYIPGTVLDINSPLLNSFFSYILTISFDIGPLFITWLFLIPEKGEVLVDQISEIGN